ncbi:MAG: sensor histidine kinase [Eubacteriales bacterium]|nr:sensor histidine kinase [Eubacteriales bacterium]
MRGQMDRGSISGRMSRLIVSMALPILLVSVLLLGLLIAFNLQYSAVNSNITDASGFNQDFKNEVDLKMYSYVTGSSTVLPTEEIETAQHLAEKLLQNTTNSESRKAINNVLHLCASLESSIDKLCGTEGYDQRMEQLETNVYVITELIQEHIYTYLFHEAGEMARLQQRMDAWLVLEIIAVLLVVVIVLPTSMRKALKISRSISDPIDALCERVEEIGAGDLEEKTPVEAEDKKLRTLSAGVEDMAGRLSQQIELNRQEQIKLRGIELSLIQAQINPHFLYNTLDAIVWLIETKKNEEAEEMVTSLSTYFRSFLSNGKDIITLGEEVQHVRSYLEIQQVRYRDILRYEIDVDPSIESCLIPKMTLQPLVENAIYHGIKPKRGVGLLRVAGTKSGGFAMLRVEDSGVGMTPGELEELRRKVDGEDETSFGLVAASKRLKLMYGSACDFSIGSEAGQGTVICIRIPIKEDGYES